MEQETKYTLDEIEVIIGKVERRIAMLVARRKDPGGWHSRDPLPDVPSGADGVLMLAAGAAISPSESDESWGKLSSYGLTPDSVSILCESSLQERLGIFQTIRSLADEGSLSLEPWGAPDECRSFAQSSLSITFAGMRRLGLDTSYVPASWKPDDNGET